MPALAKETLAALQKETRSIGPQIPRDYEYRTGFHELGIHFSVPVDHRRLGQWINDFNGLHQQDTPITVETIVTASRQHELKQMRWNSFRLADARHPGNEPIGWEHLYLGKPWDTDIVTLRLCALGLKAQEEHPDVINTLLIGGGYQALSLDQLQEASGLITKMLSHEKEQMTPQARQFRIDTMKRIQDLPPDLTQSYYFLGAKGEIIVVGTVLQQLPPHASFRRDVDWYRILRLANESELPNVTLPELRNGRLIMERLSHMTASFPHGMLDIMRPKVA